MTQSPAMLAALTLQLLLAQPAPEAAVTPEPPPHLKLLSTASVVGLASFGELIVGGTFIGLAWLIGGDSPGYLVVAGLALAPAGAWALPYAFGGEGFDGLGWSYLGGAVGGMVAGTLGWIIGNQKGSSLDAFLLAGLFGLVGQVAGSPTALGLAHYFKHPPQVAVLPTHGGGVFSVAGRF